MPPDRQSVLLTAVSRDYQNKEVEIPKSYLVKHSLETVTEANDVEMLWELGASSNLEHLIGTWHNLRNIVCPLKRKNEAN